MCPARLILLPPGSRERLTGERIAAVYATPAAAEQAAGLAEELAVSLTLLRPHHPAQADPAHANGRPVEAGLADELGMGATLPRAQHPAQADPAQADRWPVEAILREIGDQHRGETVVVVAPELRLGLELPVVIEHEGEGWTVLPTPNEVTLATYERAAERFRESIPTGVNEQLVELFDEIDARLPGGGDVLELGSGTGRDAVELERRGHRVRRTDAAGSFVEMIRADGHDAEHLNALSDDFGGPYDLVFADAVFLHFTPEQLATVLRKAHAAATHLAFTTSEGAGDEWSNRFLDLPRHFTKWQEQPLRAVLADTGWTVLTWQQAQARTSGWYYVMARRT
ncbi:class I SAM-dependent methyltransferase [Kribbella sp. NPDC051718]|uniref:class I SAM-dependent methyltransferase n=1 Tax=Kribbella sp. NPDC051718 TaxID=3155168 RepID=UPI003439257D